MKSTSYYAGLIIGAGLVLVIFFIFVAIKKKSSPKPKFDEMQLAARGNAYKAGFYTLLIANALGIMGTGIVQESRIPTFILFAAAFMTGVAVFAVSAIRNDAYFGFNENKKSSAAFIGVIGAVNLIVSILNMLSKGLYDDGEINVAVLNFFVALLSAVILTACLIHMRKASAEE